jgi:hypothetical protein
MNTPANKTAARLPGFAAALLISMAALLPVQSALASPRSEAIERIIRIMGSHMGAPAKATARKTLEKASAKFGAEVLEMTERGGIGLIEAAAKHGDDVWRLAKLSPDAPKALAARADDLLPLARRYGDSAMLAEIRLPGCGEMLASKLSGSTLRKVATEAGDHELHRLAALGPRCSAHQMEAAAKLARPSGKRALEFLTPGRIAASGFASALIIASFKAPEALINLPEIILTGPLGPAITVAGWLLVAYLLYLFRKPLFWLARQLGGLGTGLLRAIRSPASMPAPMPAAVPARNPDNPETELR